MSIKKRVVSFLRKAHLLEMADFIKFIASAAANLMSNRKFKIDNPQVALPPPFILFESFGKLSYHSYYHGGKISATFTVDLLQKHIELKNARICEWGCGPARLLRHFGELIGSENVELYGTDYNPKTIEWCRKNLHGITFSLNSLHPPLDYNDEYFNVLYCYSVFTHLSQQLQKEWVEECMRVVKPGGIFLVTVHGDSCASGLLSEQLRKYRNKGVLILGSVKEGKRSYSSYNSPDYMRNELLKGFAIEEHIIGKGKEQDIWIVRK